MSRILLTIVLSLLLVTPQAQADDTGLAPLVEVLGLVDDAAVQSDLLVGMREGLKGRKSVPSPAGWAGVYAKLAKSDSASVREHALALALLFDDPTALAELRQIVSDAKASTDERNKAIELLVEKRVDKFAPTLQAMLPDVGVQRAALRGLAAYADAKTPTAILAVYPQLDAEAKQDAITTLASRREFALALLEAIENKQVPRTDVTSFTARQLLALRDDKLSAKVKEVWGDSRETPQDKLDKIEKLKTQLTSARLAAADVKQGRRIFQKTCQQCHLLYGEGAKIGPDLTGSNRANLEYVLSNVIDPSAAIAKEYKMNTVLTTDGRVLTGMIVEKTGDRLTLQTVNERIVLLPDDIDELKESPLSMMPEGQFDQLTSDEIRDLVAYLATKQQVE